METYRVKLVTKDGDCIRRIVESQSCIYAIQDAYNSLMQPDRSVVKWAHCFKGFVYICSKSFDPVSFD